jgi:hypothetical protein
VGASIGACSGYRWLDEVDAVGDRPDRLAAVATRPRPSVATKIPTVMPKTARLPHRAEEQPVASRVSADRETSMGNRIERLER